MLSPTSPPPTRSRKPSDPKFVTGSLLRHILVMTGTSALGLMAIFIGDLANIFFLSQLGDTEIIAAVSYGSSIAFLTIAIGIGLAIAATSVVSTALGAGHRTKARRLSANAHLWTFTVASVLAVIVWLAVPWLLAILGAKGRTADLASDYLRIIIPTLPLLAVGMTSSAVMRSAGDAKRAMYVTMAGAFINILLDPLLIFGLDLGIHGAALASAISRFAILSVGLYGVIVIHNMVGRPKLRTWLADARPLALVAIPAVATNIATPFANAYVTSAVSAFGDDAVAGWGIVGRLLPVAFGSIYALSGSVGPIIGQNYGAGAYERMQRVLILALAVNAGFCLMAWIVLALFTDTIVAQFAITGEAAALVRLFTTYLAPWFVFLGAMFVANAAFNTLGRPHISTLLNWGRATIGTIPAVLVGAHYFGSAGVLMGNMFGGVVFGTLGVVLCARHLAAIKDQKLTENLTTEGKELAHLG